MTKAAKDDRIGLSVSFARTGVYYVKRSFAMNDQELYSSIYDIVEKNAEAAGSRLETDKECFLCLAESEPCRVDVLEMSREKDNMRFIQKAYISMLKRIVDPAALDAWKLSADLEPAEFQLRAVNGLKLSEEFFLTHVKLENNIYATNNPASAAPAAVPGSSVSMPEKLMRTYRKMPEFMKKAVRRMMGVR